MTKLTVRQYVESNSFTDTERELFNFIVETFPETVLIQEGEESEDILALLVILAKAFGNIRELIINLESSHSFSELIQKIDDNYLTEPNKALMLTLVEEMKYSNINQSITVEDAKDNLIEERALITDFYNIIKFRGTETAIKQIIRNLSEYIDFDIKDYILTVDAGQVQILFAFVLEELIDYDQNTISIPDPEDSEAPDLNVYKLLEGNIVSKMLFKYKQAGIIYNIYIRAFLNSIYNLFSDRVIASAEKENLLGTQVSAELLGVTAGDISTDIKVNTEFTSFTMEENKYWTDNTGELEETDYAWASNKLSFDTPPTYRFGVWLEYLDILPNETAYYVVACALFDLNDNFLGTIFHVIKNTHTGNTVKFDLTKDTNYYDSNDKDAVKFIALTIIMFDPEPTQILIPSVRLINSFSVTLKNNSKVTSQIAFIAQWRTWPLHMGDKPFEELDPRLAYVSAFIPPDTEKTIKAFVSFRWDNDYHTTGGTIPNFDFPESRLAIYFKPNYVSSEKTLTYRAKVSEINT